MSIRRLTTNGLTTPHLIYIILSLGMIGVSIYMTVHFYETHFPSGIAKTSTLCDFSQFWSCDKTTLSPLGNIFYVPTAFFGAIIGLLAIIGAVFASETLERTNKFFILLNAAGCIILVGYSLIALGGLCLMCTLYYIMSWGCAFLFIKFSNARPFPEIRPTIAYGLLVIIPSLLMYNKYVSNLKNQNSLSIQYVDQYKNLKDLGDPIVESKFKIHMSTDSFESAPIRISLFSDFQCPFCKVVSDQMHELAKEFDGKINIQYFFYPLDNLCNPKVNRMFHQFACKAAYIAACSEEKFAKVHDTIFHEQNKLSDEQLVKWEKQFGLEGCMADENNRKTVVDYIGHADQYKLKSTPTIIVNGKKIEGTVKTPYFKAILRSLLK